MHVPGAANATGFAPARAGLAFSCWGAQREGGVHLAPASIRLRLMLSGSARACASSCSAWAWCSLALRIMASRLPGCPLME
jgi:hypothetical protein